MDQSRSWFCSRSFCVPDRWRCEGSDSPPPPPPPSPELRQHEEVASAFLTRFQITSHFLLKKLKNMSAYSWKHMMKAARLTEGSFGSDSSPPHLPFLLAVTHEFDRGEEISCVRFSDLYSLITDNFSSLQIRRVSKQSETVRRSKRTTLMSFLHPNEDFQNLIFFKQIPFLYFENEADSVCAKHKAF